METGIRFAVGIALVLAVAGCTGPQVPPGRISGMVLSADRESNRVVIDRGKRDGVVMGMKFVITTIDQKQTMPNAKVFELENLRCVTTYPGVFRMPVNVGDEARGVE